MIMRAKLEKKENGYILHIPSQLAVGLGDPNTLNITKLRDGMLLLFSDSAGKSVFSTEVDVAKGTMSQLSKEELGLVSKLSRIRFENRQVPYVYKLLNLYEKKILAALLEKKIIEVYKNKKYPEGVYSISSYAYYNGQASQNTAPPESKRIHPPVNKLKIKGSAMPINTLEHLEKLGYMVLESENEAKIMMSSIKDKIKRDEIKGVRSFDKKYYVLKREFLLDYQDICLDQLEDGPKDSAEIAKATGLTVEAVTTMMLVLGEQGDIIEKRRGVWQKA